MEKKLYRKNKDNIKIMKGFFNNDFGLNPLMEKETETFFLNHRCVLPLDPNITIRSQFGFLPVSIIEPTKSSKQKWEDHHAYLDVFEVKRSQYTNYLPELRFSEFHAGLAEIIVRYWSVKGDLIIDPFCGRATRAVVSAKLNRRYIGFDVSEKTYKRVKKRIRELGLEDLASIELSDGCRLEGIEKNSADFSFTCPPYHQLEVYEEGGNQLSRIKEYSLFLEQIGKCIKRTFKILKRGKFCCWVVADFRAKGALVDFTFDCLHLFKQHGFIHWDTIIIKNISPFAALTTHKSAAKRYTSKIHETLLVFRKPE